MQSATARITLRRELKINVTDADIKAYYDKHSADFEQPELAHVRHILLMTIDPSTRMPLPTNTVSAKRKQIDDLLKQARGGADFVELATKYSEDPGSKINGGELPEFPHGQMLPEFEAAAFSLTNGQVSDVVATIYGFHIIKMIGKTPAKKYTLNDTLPMANKTVSDICKNEVEADKVKDLAPAYVKNLRKELGVEVVDPNLKSMDDNLRTRFEGTQGSDQSGSAK
jgi:peptidyl-prolyl cis-trans isomerase D